MNFSEQTKSRRSSTRARKEQPVVLRIVEQTVAGNAENCSGSGALFYTGETLSVEIDYEEDGVHKTRTGRLVRTERVSDTRQSWAVQFDEVSPNCDDQPS